MISIPIFLLSIVVSFCIGVIVSSICSVRMINGTLERPKEIQKQVAKTEEDSADWWKKGKRHDED